MTFSKQCKKTQFPSFKILKANFFWSPFIILRSQVMAIQKMVVPKKYQNFNCPWGPRAKKFPSFFFGSIFEGNRTISSTKESVQICFICDVDTHFPFFVNGGTNVKPL